jgi:hypothetical protein
MAEERVFGVAEARLGLTLLTCLLVMLGYAILQRLGGGSQPPPLELRPGQSAGSRTSVPRYPLGSEPQLQVLTAQEGESPAWSAQQVTSMSPRSLRKQFSEVASWPARDDASSATFSNAIGNQPDASEVPQRTSQRPDKPADR